MIFLPIFLWMKSESEFIFMRYIASAQKFGKHKCPQVFHYLKNHKNHCWFTKVCKWWWWFEVKSRNDNSTKISGHLSYIPSSLYICYFLFHLTFAIFKQSSNPRHDVITIILLLWNLPPPQKKKNAQWNSEESLSSEICLIIYL